MAKEGLTRREFLDTVWLAGWGLILAELGIEAPPLEVIAFGLLLSGREVDPEVMAAAKAIKPNLVPKGLPEPLGYVEVVGTKGYNYLVKTQKGLVGVDLEDVLILGGDPFPVARRTSFLGIRNDVPELMPLVEQAGLGPVRIARNFEEITAPQRTKLTDLIEAAGEIDAPVLAVFNPRFPRPEAEIRAAARTLAKMGVDIELLNEPNEMTFWEKGDLKTAAQTISIAWDEIKKTSPKTRILAAALTDPNRMKEFLENLKEAGVNLRQIEFAVHAYGDVGVVKWVVDTVYQATRRPVVVTEVGVRGDDKHEIVPILDLLWQMRRRGEIAQVFIHELPDYEGWGYYSPFLKTKESFFYYLPAWVKQHGG